MQLISLLNKYRNQVNATTDCHRKGTDNFPHFTEICLLTILVSDQITSQKISTDKNTQKQCEILHQISRSELKTLFIILRHSRNVKTINEKLNNKGKMV